MAPCERGRRYGPWSDLQSELLHLVIRRLPSLADRVRLRAVCRSWRCHAALLEVLPPAPWLLLPDGAFLDISSGEIHSRVYKEPFLIRHGSVGNWLFLEHYYDGRCSLTDPISKDDAALQLPDVLQQWHLHNMNRADCTGNYWCIVKKKLVLLSSTAEDVSSDSAIALLTMDRDAETTISIYAPTTTPVAFRSTQHDIPILDIAFFDGKLYAISMYELFVIEIDLSSHGDSSPRFQPMKRILGSIGDTDQAIQDCGTSLHTWYLVESNGRLLLVKRIVSLPLPTLSFDIFVADLAATDPSTPLRRVNSLEGQALFVGTYSRSLTASEERGVQEDCIFFSDFLDECGMEADEGRRFYGCGVFNLRSGIITPLLTESVLAAAQDHAGAGLLRWFFPHKVM